jgi:hypothetical protein
VPFARSARIAPASSGQGESDVQLEVATAPSAFTEQSLYFHAGWRAPERFPSAPSRDWQLGVISGHGFYVGNVLDVLNGNTQWWGEGDEKIYVDGEAFPSHFGTGTEDYYGYAWCSNERFTTGYVGQPLSTAHRSFGWSTLYRFHILDPIPFTRSLRFDLEVRHWGDPVEVAYDAVNLWYARPGSRLEGAATDPSVYRVPALAAPPPSDVPPGAYTCG